MATNSDTATRREIEDTAKLIGAIQAEMGGRAADEADDVDPASGRRALPSFAALNRVNGTNGAKSGPGAPDPIAVRLGLLAPSAFAMHELDLEREPDEDEDSLGSDFETDPSGGEYRMPIPRGSSLEETMRLRDHFFYGKAIEQVAKAADEAEFGKSLAMAALGLGAVALLRSFLK